jgi:hypothetical protein
MIRRIALKDMGYSNVDVMRFIGTNTPAVFNLTVSTELPKS